MCSRFVPQQVFARRRNDRGLPKLEIEELCVDDERTTPYDRAMTFALFTAAALFEIAGCFAFWSYFRLGRPAWMLVVGLIALALFAYALTRVDVEFAGRAYAAYGGIYVVASLVWLRMVEGVRPDRWDLTGAALCIAGATVIVLGRR